MNSSSNHANTLKKIIDSDSLLLSIGDVANAIDVSTRQLRYWEKKGYIKSKISKSGQRKYTYFTLLQAGDIAGYINEGYTLASAAEKTANNARIMKRLRQFLQTRFDNGYEIEGGYEIDLGEIKDVDAEQHLHIDLMKDGESFFQIKKKDK